MKHRVNFVKHLVLSALAAMVCLSSPAQQNRVSGTVTDIDGAPLIGTSVVVSGTTQGTVTDANGNYSLTAGPDAILEFSYLGYETVREPVSGRTTVDISLTDGLQIDEVVVVGYATGNARSVSGAVERIKAAEMNTGYVSNPLEAIQGKVPGMVISRSGGSLGEPTVRLRGTTSLSGGSDPLVVIDGVFSTLSVLSQIPAQDIAEMTILKDASEAAQYGSRGAAGVIVVTTVKGREGVANVSYNGQFGVSLSYKNIEMLDATGFRALNNSLTAGGMDLGHDTNWFNWVQNKLVTQNNHNLSLTQGTSKSNMHASVGVNQRTGRLRNSSDMTYNARLNASQKALRDKLNFEVNLSATYRQAEPELNVWSSAQVYNPTFPSWRNPDTGLWDVEPAAQSMTTHPGEMMDTRQQRDNTRIAASGRATWQIMDGLSLAAFGSFNLSNSLDKTYYRNDVSGYAGVRGEARVSNTNGREWLGNVQLNYVKEIGKHSITALALVEGQKDFMFRNGAIVQGFDTNYFAWNNLRAGAVINWGNVTSSAVESTLLSYLGRLNYMFDEKYVITVNARADGSSKLGKNHKWGFFPSVSAAWIMTNEGFMQNQTLFSNIKLRASYGVTGNQSAISPLNSLELMEPSGLSTYNSQSVVTYGITRNSNPDLKWEVKQTFDIGFDVSMFRGRLRGTFDYYRSTTKDMLYTYSVSVPPFVYSTLLANLGKMTNNGFELSVVGEVVQNRDWRLSLRGNIAYNKNKLVSLQGTYMGEEFTTPEWINVTSQGGAGMVGNTGVTYMAEGHPVGVFRLPVHDGFDTDADGRKMYKFKDLDGSGSIDLGDVGDREILGQVVPKFTTNLGATLRYKRMDMSMQMSGAFGHHIYNFTTMALSNMNMFPVYNVLADAPERNIYDIKHTSYWLERGDYVNIEYITLGYNFPMGENSLFSDARVAISCNNVATITGYSGLTPLINSANFRSGIDARNVTPLQRTFTLQLQLRF